MKKLILVLAMLVLGTQAYSENTPYQGVEHFAKTKEQRVKWFKEAKLGLFIHWGLYSVGGGYFAGKKHSQHYAEWIQCWSRATTDKYAGEFADEFTAVKYNPNDWAKLAKRMGVRYSVLTSKHHDGFTLFRTKEAYAKPDGNPYGVNVNISPKGRDLFGEYAQAFRDQGIHVGVYYSLIDWQHPDSPSHQWLNQDKRTNDTPTYIKYYQNQLREIMSNYGQIDLLWSDYSDAKNQGDAWDTKGTLEMIEKLQPNIVLSNRFWNGLENPYGDYITPEKYVPETGFGNEAWEVCHTMNESFGFSYHDDKWKSAEELFKIMIDANSKGGNLLLNIGPDKEGLIPAKAVSILEEFADIVQKYNNQIFGTTASKFSYLNFDGRSTTEIGKDKSKINFFIYEYPQDGRLVVDRLKNKITKVYMPASSEALHAVKQGDETVIILPKVKSDKFGWVVTLEIEGSPEVEELPYAIQSSDRNVAIRTAKFELKGGVKMDVDRGIGNWKKEGQKIVAEFKITKPGPVKHTGGTVEQLSGKYKVELEYASKNGFGGKVKVKVADKTFDAEITGTGDWHDKKRRSIGEITFTKADLYKISIESTKVNKELMNFYGVKLIPID